MQKKLAPVLSILLIAAIVVAAVFGVQKNELTKEVAELKTQLSASKTTADGLTADVSAAKKSLDTANADLAAAASKAAELETKVADLTAQAETAAADLAAAKDELAAAAANLDASAAKAAELDTKVADLTAQNETAAAKVAELEAKITELTAQNETAAADAAAAKAALETANADLAASAEKVVELKAKVEALLPRVIDFEDGNYAFLGVDTAAGNADASELSVVEYKKGNALRVDVKAKVPYIAINVEGLLGENLEKVRAISFDAGVELGSDGKFYAASGKVYTVTAGGDTKTGYDWSVYLKNKNPKTAKVTLKDVFFTNGQGDTMLITKEADAFVDSGKFAGEEPRDIYIDNLQFLDENGEALPLDLTAVWTAPETGADLSNLSVLSNAVELTGMAVEGGAWSQNGVEMNPEFLAALVPGSVVEISYESEDGDIWVVMPWSSAGWIRVAQGQATKNNSKCVAQITYEQFAALLGEDTSTWGAMFQCEGSSAWKVYSVKVGTPNAKIALSNKVEFAGFTCEGGAWGQNGFEFTQEVLDALQPGTALEIDFESDSGDMWIVLPDSAAGWMRVQMMSATVIGNKAYITYEQIAEVVGEDKTQWGARLQCEASGNWSVYAVNVGKVNKLVGVKEVVDFAGFACEGGAWGQNGFEMTEEIKAALKPGCVVTINYESDSGDMWLVFPDSAAGWMRVQMMSADCDGATAQITWDEMAAVLGEDVSTWGARMQCEASGNWKVFSVNVAQAQ